ncbi:hypothetical protein CONCODRAFT_7726 [Conidiobolus coronatus NRRL 28638]|uniref:Pyridoxal phosphate homeostasis protein n=1 Tax=Conidiobolus coronatus (strain ATCC 28846 / CBS 209.66 / NRRL 28638) TaxID=796925 RepID=A0A137P424_CONC2|nr:hypothetical protein CONCODRAFT_7726 [Conidiobolus coronatus NRRL 28638]|eukprot:KXN69778.1 hypothetical protein CONCODRAFT_7726 [Conidiobolus coronatus NRRL 28638]
MSTTRVNEVQDNLNEVKLRVNKASEVSGKPLPRLVAVSKTKPVEDLLAAYDLGQRHFGENYVQELIEKSEKLPKDINWHYIGALQSNKIKPLTQISNLYAIETLDSAKKAQKLNSFWEGESKLNVFIQVNTSNEDNKNGIDGEEIDNIAAHILKECPKLNLMGLMTIGSVYNSVNANEEGINPDFEELVKLKATLDTKYNINLELSMGMSSDFEQAILQGSTSVRVGSDIFGARNYPPKN